MVRGRAKDWNIDPDRIGMVGFSAGAMLTMATAIAGEDAKPAFLGDIYGPLAALPVPANAPPLFVALAAGIWFVAPRSSGPQVVSTSAGAASAAAGEDAKIKIISRGEAVEIAQHLRDGRYTVVDFTADW